MEVMDFSEGEQEMEEENAGNNEVVEIDFNVPENNEIYTAIQILMGNVGCAEADKTEEEPKETVVSDVDIDYEQTCPICMDLWTNSGEHRLCCLRCGHLFGHCCILRWLQTSCTSTNRRCPQCNRKATVKEIRMLYAKKVTSIDTAELDALKDQLNCVSAEKNRIELELSKYMLRQKMYDQQLSSMQTRITQLESQQSQINQVSRFTKRLQELLLAIM